MTIVLVSVPAVTVMVDCPGERPVITMPLVPVFGETDAIIAALVDHVGVTVAFDGVTVQLTVYVSPIMIVLLAPLSTRFVGGISTGVPGVTMIE